MSGIQVTGLYSGLNWGTLVNELVAADSIPMNQMQGTVSGNSTKVSTLASLSTDLTGLQTANDALSEIGTNVFQGVVATLPATSTWTGGASSGTPLGSYSIAVSQLATTTTLTGATGVSAALSSTSSVSGVTLSSMHVATPPTAGTITVNGNPVTVSLSESLSDVLTAISTATSGQVTGSYDPTTDKVTLTSTAGTLRLGAANDTSNLLQSLKLTGGSGASATSSSALGSVSTGSPIGSAGFKTAFTGLTAGAGTVTINGVAINYDTTKDSLTTILGRINNSGAGVTASYDSSSDKVTLVNNVTGAIALNAADTSGNLLGVLGLTGTGAVNTQGLDSKFSVNGGPTRTSTSNKRKASRSSPTKPATTRTSKKPPKTPPSSGSSTRS